VSGRSAPMRARRLDSGCAIACWTRAGYGSYVSGRSVDRYRMSARSSTSPLAGSSRPVITRNVERDQTPTTLHRSGELALIVSPRL
jgi:hypothetical protein